MTAMDKGSQLELNEAGLVFGICPQNNVSVYLSLVDYPY